MKKMRVLAAVTATLIINGLFMVVLQKMVTGW
jgi:hypothetical protein